MADVVDNTMQKLATDIRVYARDLGFDLVGFTTADPIETQEYYRQWLADQKHGSMTWLADRVDERTDPRTYVPDAQSIICLAINYHQPLEAPPPDQKVPGRIARYALGIDYHEHIKNRLYALADWIRHRHPDATTRCCVDTAPVAEKVLAARAGIGWVGKHTLVINPKIGSWLLLGEIITSLKLPIDRPHIDRCGTCRRCIDACPTHAITAPYQLDARKCIAYLTIENRDPIDPDLAPLMGDRMVGCDICQEVCPYNRHPPIATAPQFKPRFPSATLDAEQVEHWPIEHYRTQLTHSAIKRVKLPLLQRNARIVLDNAHPRNPWPHITPDGANHR